MEDKEGLGPEELEQQILDEVQKSVEENGNEGYQMYLDNFHLRLPTGFTSAGGKLRERSSHLTNTTYAERERQTAGEPNQYSPILQNQTPEQFFQTIDQVLTQVIDEAIQNGLDPKKLEELKNPAIRGNINLEELLKILLPVYIKLRQMGYSHRDLTT